MNSKHRNTVSVRSGIGSDPQTGSVSPPLYLSTTYEFNGFKSPRDYEYSRVKNPTRQVLAELLADLEQGAAAIVTSSGMSAITSVLQLLSPEDLLIVPHDCYGGSYRLFTNYAKKGWFKLKIIDFSTELTRENLQEWKPSMVWLETPSNPLLRLVDIEAICRLAKDVDALVVADNTFLSPALQNPLKLGADIVVHSTTKYLNGHSDVVGGAIIANTAELGETLAWWANCIGATGSAFDSYLTVRGIRTLYPRIKQHEENARKVAEFLEQHECVTHVYYPGLQSHPQHELAKRQQSGFGGMISFELAGDVNAVEQFFASLTCFSLAESLGGTESLICHPASMTHAAMDEEALAVAGISNQLIRVSVGIEWVEDLLADLDAALNASQQNITPAKPALW